MRKQSSIAYNSAGNGVPLVFLHGLTYDQRIWQPVIEQLKSYFRCVSVDLPGHGESADAASYELETGAKALHNLVDRLELVEPIVIGHSIAGVLAAVYAAVYPVRALMTVDQPLQVTPFLTRLQTMRDQLRSPAFLNVWREIEAGLGINLVPYPFRSLIENASNPRQEVVLGYWREALDLPPEELQARVTAALAQVKVPFTALFGKEVDPEYRSWLAAACPQCIIIEFANAGHFPHLVDLKRFTACVKDLTTRALRSSAA